MLDNVPVLSVIQQSEDGKESPMIRWAIHQVVPGKVICSVSLQIGDGLPCIGILIPAIMEVVMIRRGQRLILGVS